jgi:hypothetical protein
LSLWWSGEFNVLFSLLLLLYHLELLLYCFLFYKMHILWHYYMLCHIILDPTKLVCLKNYCGELAIIWWGLILSFYSFLHHNSLLRLILRKCLNWFHSKVHFLKKKKKKQLKRGDRSFGSIRFRRRKWSQFECKMQKTNF